MIQFKYEDVKRIKEVIRLIEKKNAEIHSGKLAQWVAELEDLIERGVGNE